MPTRPLALAAGLVGLGVIVVASLAYRGPFGAERPERAALRGSPAAAHEELERLEGTVPSGGPRDDGLWRAHLDVVLRELEHGHLDVAIRAWRDAYGAALASRGWEGMIAVGDVFLAIGRASGTARGARMNARDAYLVAVIRARRDRSVDGALRSAEAFRELDDRALAEQSLRIAGQLADGDELAQQRVREAWRHWTAPPTLTDF
jgi:hypothetical protein